MVKIWELTEQRRWQRGEAGFDLVVLDAPATGHALGLLNSPKTFAGFFVNFTVSTLPVPKLENRIILGRDDSSGHGSGRLR